uniref:AlNc14C345G10846 protein n=1 Tax=Albugo laibachii Nc14 TaxID=890382 RepID=F0WX91_9STRA|nr:AlNc14C345G10846 [Albugo laibachii Nc14]|eukprot:CCA26083.1 AlNc14C345G10846 [Albugo laibachii Nc14]
MRNHLENRESNRCVSSPIIEARNIGLASTPSGSIITLQAKWPKNILMEGIIKTRKSSVSVMHDRYCVAFVEADSAGNLMVILRSFKSQQVFYQSRISIRPKAERRKNRFQQNHSPISREELNGIPLGVRDASISEYQLAWIKDWDGKGRFHQYTYAFQMESMDGKIFQCVAQSRSEKRRWMRIVDILGQLKVANSRDPYFFPKSTRVRGIMRSKEEIKNDQTTHHLSYERDKKSSEASLCNDDDEDLQSTVSECPSSPRPDFDNIEELKEDELKIDQLTRISGQMDLSQIQEDSILLDTELLLEAVQETDRSVEKLHADTVMSSNLYSSSGQSLRSGEELQHIGHGVRNYASFGSSEIDSVNLDLELRNDKLNMIPSNSRNHLSGHHFPRNFDPSLQLLQFQFGGLGDAERRLERTNWLNEYVYKKAKSFNGYDNLDLMFQLHNPEQQISSEQRISAEQRSMCNRLNTADNDRGSSSTSNFEISDSDASNSERRKSHMRSSSAVALEPFYKSTQLMASTWSKQRLGYVGGMMCQTTLLPAMCFLNIAAHLRHQNDRMTPIVQPEDRSDEIQT